MKAGTNKIKKIIYIVKGDCFTPQSPFSYHIFSPLIILKEHN